MSSQPLSRRLRRTLLVALAAATVALPVSGAARASAVPAPAPTARPALTSAAPAVLAARYAAERTDILAAGQAAERHGDRTRAAELRTMAGPGRQFLAFDGRDGGRSTEVVGDLAGAEWIAVLVPGSDTDLDTYHRLRDDAVALQRQLGPRGAVVAWLGYATPSTFGPEVLTTGRADSAAPALRALVRELDAIRPTARTSVLCHSYGSVVCARTAAGKGGLDVADLVLYGSPGTGYDDVAALHTRAAVWAGRGGCDWIADVPHVRVPLPFVTVGFGADPVSAQFGANVFAAGGGGHSDYLKPGGTALVSMARIVAGQDPRTPAPPAPLSASSSPSSAFPATDSEAPRA